MWCPHGRRLLVLLLLSAPSSTFTFFCGTLPQQYNPASSLLLGESSCIMRIGCVDHELRRRSTKIRRSHASGSIYAKASVAADAWKAGEPFAYIEPLFRPPAEAGSLILQVTNGCSWNKCTFCDMYTADGKEFRPKPLERIEEELKMVARMRVPVKRIFLADGDAMTLPTKRLKDILSLISEHMPGKLQRISSYCLPRNVREKSVEDLRELRDLGLSLVYVGCESGDDEVLRRINKGETFESSADALRKLGEAGIKRSVMILNGLGGPQLSDQHAKNTARLMNLAQPELLSTLVVSFPFGTGRFEQTSPGFRELTKQELFAEMETLIGNLELDKTIFRSDHASNWLPLKGLLSRDKDKLLMELAAAKKGKVHLRPEWARGL